ncbi:MAG: response regulator [Gammaproteobacteria bacterium]|nr:MAG: response regulator [Gammaproteobacteria bacterium]
MYSNSSYKPIVLIVDDDPSLRLIMCSFASENGYTPIDASGADEAKILLEKYTPDIALIDGYMPGMNGFDFCQYLKENPATANMPVILITGLDDDQSVQRGFSSGADDFVTKPIHWAVLRHRMAVFTRLGESKRSDDADSTVATSYEILANIQKACKEKIDTIISVAHIGKDSIGEVEVANFEDLFSTIENCGEELHNLINKLNTK